MATKETRRRLLEEQNTRHEFLAPPDVRRRLLDPAEAAAILGVRVNTLAKYRMDWRGPPFVRLGTRIRYDADRLEEYIRNVSEPTSDHPLTSRG